MSNLFVRRAIRRELPDIEQLILAAFSLYRGQVSAPVVLEAYIENSRNIASRWDEAEILAVEVNGCIGGTVTWYADASREGLNWPRDWAGFRTLAVHPDLRGLGLGRTLVRDCIRRSAQRGVATIGIHTADFMAAACRIYDSLGFRRIPSHDLSVSKALHCDPNAGDVLAIAYRLDLVKPFTESR
jgi:GNAT superfamily N-acetyltransferase